MLNFEHDTGDSIVKVTDKYEISLWQNHGHPDSYCIVVEDLLAQDGKLHIVSGKMTHDDALPVAKFLSGQSIRLMENRVTFYNSSF